MQRTLHFIITLVLLVAATTAWAQVDVPLTLEAIADGTTITVTNPKSGMQYSIDGGAKQPVTSASISISAAQKVQFYGNGTSITSYDGTWIKCSQDCYIYGNIMSLVDENGFAAATTLTADNTFLSLFSNNTHLKNHSTNKLVLPATRLTTSCYTYMFSSCTSLTTAPELPAKTLAVGCYDGMFGGCTSLTTAPELPATTLTVGCYAHMFEGCTSLTTAPELPATTLATYCYFCMFRSCTNLSYVRCLATNIEARDCTSDWLKDVASSGTFVKAEGMTSWTTGASGIPEGWTVFESMHVQPLTLEAIADGTITVTDPKNGMQYSINGGAKTALTTGNNQIQVSAGQKVQFYGNGTSITSYNETRIQCSADCYIYGNIMSLVDETHFATATTLTSDETFAWLFSGNIHLKNHPTRQLVLPATTLAKGCYNSMFYDCRGLTVAPELPATTLAEDCYNQMFYDCTGLTAAPELPATTLADHCYYAMFMHSGLYAAPALPATTLANGCYQNMFRGCTSLTAAPMLPATTLAEECYSKMFQSCTSLSYVRCLATNIEASDCTSEWLKDVATQGTFVKAENTNWRTGVSGIPEGWTVVEGMKGLPLTLEAIADGTITVTSPKSGMQYSIDGGAKTALTTRITEIPVSAGQKVQFYGNGTSIASYWGTFIGCNTNCYIYGNIMSLVDEKLFPAATTLTEAGTFIGLFSGNTHLKNHPDYQLVLPATTLTLSCYDSMFQNCSGLTVAPELPATTLTTSCYTYMFQGCTSLTEAPELPATTLAPSCYQNMFEDCSGLTVAPELPATTLAENCYEGMFENCTSLNYVKCMATDISAEGCTSEWLKNVASSGIFEKAKGMTGWDSGISGIPEGWTVKSYTSAPALTLEAIADGTTITVENPKSGMQYSIDGGAKTAITTTATTDITVSAGQKVQFYGNDTNITSYNGTRIQCSKDCYIYGNIMSLVDENDFATATTLTADYTFTGLFFGNGHLKSHQEKNLVLPATKLTKFCYSNMFNGCSGLTTAPELPATKPAVYCYAAMFENSGLYVAPALPATTLAEGCYASMFQGCSNLRSAPELLAPTLTKNCYQEMFKYCDNLSYVKCLATYISADNCTTEWLYNVSSVGTFVKAAKTNWSTGASGIPRNWTVFEPMQVQPLTLEAIADGTITVTSPKSGMQYSIDGGDKTAITTTATTEIPVTAGHTVQFYGNGTSITSYNGTRIKCSADCYIYGNIMSLVDETDFATATTLTQDEVFAALFYDYNSNDYLKNHPTKQLVLPATTLTKNCYQSMFGRCTSLTEAPELPATELKNDCYRSMFSGCTSLTAAPELPATTLAEECYYGMFEGCSSLTEAHELPATELTTNCYSRMFYGCTSLIKAPELPATKLATSCYAYMFENCTSLTEAPDLPATELETNCYRFMFNGCTNLTKAPVLTAPTLAKDCYNCMFSGCRKLNYLKCLATNISAENCTYYWLSGVAAQGLFEKAEGMEVWTTGISGIPEGWTAVGPNGITLYDTGDNRATLDAKDGQTLDYVLLDGRTLYRDGTWNSLCLPFNVSDGDTSDGITFTGTPLEGATVVCFDGASFSGGTLTLNFGDVTAITAGMPYLVKWTTTGGNLQSPIFYNVKIFKDLGYSMTSNVISFQGTYATITYEEDDHTILYLGADDKLYYPLAGATIGACRAYFKLLGGLTAGDPDSSVQSIALNFDDVPGATEIPSTTNLTNYTNSDAWYTLDGRKLDKRPTVKGVYVNNGLKVVIK